MPNQALPFFSGEPYPNRIPLARYLPPYQAGLLPKMLQAKGISSGWILDPLGSQPLAAIDLAQHGYAVFMSCNNPILALITEVLSHSPPLTEWNAALTELGSTRIREQRLETFVQQPFIGQCPKCGRSTNSVSFIWRREALIPDKKELTCQHCNTNFEEPLIQKDLENLTQIGNTALHQSRAIQRIFSNQEPYPQTLQFIQEAYHQRALSTIVLLFNHLDGLKTTPLRKKILELLVVSAFDHATTLWPHNQFNTRPRQIVTPTEYIEVNPWLMMEKTAKQLGAIEKPVVFKTYPEINLEEGGICLYPNRYREHEIHDIPDIQAVGTILPRPNQALWSLSSIWSGWLWGNQFAYQIKSALTRQRYDWFWLTNALKKVFNQTSKNVRWLAVAPELTPGYTVSYLSAASANGFRLTDFAYSTDEKMAQLYWDKTYTPIAIGSPPTSDKILVEYLENKGDSASYSELFNYYILRTAKENLILKSGIIPDSNLLINIQKRFENNLQNTKALTQIDRDSIQYGEYWLKVPPLDLIPHVDRFEETFYQLIQQKPVTSGEISQLINQQFPGYLPVSSSWLNKFLNAYCNFTPESGLWSLKPQDFPETRQQDFSYLLNGLITLGEKYLLNCTLGSNFVVWKTKSLQVKFFVILTSSFYQFKALKTPDNEIVVLYPGSRAELAAEKIKENHLYKNLFDTIHYLKFRYVRNLIQTPPSNLDAFLKSLDLDPAISTNYEQLSMF